MLLKGKHCFYDEIPEVLFQRANSILEVGAADGWNQIKSKHKEHFKRTDYLGIDPVKQSNPLLDVIQADILKWDTDKTFDLVLAIHVIEHIDQTYWVELFKRLKRWSKGGYLIIGCPLNEVYDGINHSCKYSPHVVFGITPDILKRYLPNLKSVRLGEALPVSFRLPHESRLWATARMLRRLLTGNNNAYCWIPRARRILAVWKG